MMSPGSQENNSDQEVEVTLRPQTLKEYIGQSQIKKNLSIFIEAAKKRNDPLEHILIHGSPGLGKTTLANIIAKECAVNIKITSGPALEKQGDIAAILSSLKNRDILFIDEIHRLKPAIEEVLYTAMEDFGIDLVIGKGPSARTMRLKLPKFTLIGATTKMSMLSSPLRDRFGSVLHLNFYDDNDICTIIERSAKLLNCNIENSAGSLLATASRNTPRIANRLLRRIRDFKDYYGHDIITTALVADALKELGIDELGLDETDRQILKTIIDKFKGGPVGLNTIAASICAEESTIEEVYEPFLLKLGMMERTPRGRLATENAYKHLGMSIIS
ncbi:Holliday junction branch migration DNA helicase RuvB [Candidatus Peregrinibacteria bacterium]|nr:Holliday junction branch migration DNA helicase RuvB [Candidatus Peregrinibacteria bacterium]